MSRQDWYRNSDWNAEIEVEFKAKLRRARDKSQYLRIQACSLTSAKPEVALKLLDRYFEFDVSFDWAQGYVDQATAYLALGSLENALLAYESALAREVEFPKLKTTAYFDYPFLVATQKVVDRYQNALMVLTDRSVDLMFPLDKFKLYTSKALILFAQGYHELAQESASLAIQESDAAHSGFPNHPKVGLVGGEFETVKAQLLAIVKA